MNKRLGFFALMALLGFLLARCSNDVTVASEADADADTDADADIDAGDDADTGDEPDADKDPDSETFIDTDIEEDTGSSPDSEMADGDVSDSNVRVLLIVDQSNSLICTDNSNRRRVLISEIVGSVPTTHVAYLGFNSTIYRTGFSDFADIEAEMIGFLHMLGPAADFQGALASALELLDSDMSAIDESDRERMEYRIFFITDGRPEPRCHSGCEDSAEMCSDDEDNDGDKLIDGEDPDCASPLDTTFPICNADIEIPDGEYVDFDGSCPDYNLDDGILDKVSDINALGDLYGIARISLNTYFISDPDKIVEARCPGTEPRCSDVAVLLRAMAERGEGEFLSYYDGECI